MKIKFCLTLKFLTMRGFTASMPKCSVLHIVNADLLFSEKIFSSIKPIVGTLGLKATYSFKIRQLILVKLKWKLKELLSER